MDIVIKNNREGMNLLITFVNNELVITLPPRGAVNQNQSEFNDYNHINHNLAKNSQLTFNLKPSPELYDIVDLDPPQEGRQDGIVQWRMLLREGQIYHIGCVVEWPDGAEATYSADKLLPKDDFTHLPEPKPSFFKRISNLLW